MAFDPPVLRDTMRVVTNAGADARSGFTMISAGIHVEQ